MIHQIYSPYKFEYSLQDETDTNTYVPFWVIKRQLALVFQTIQINQCDSLGKNYYSETIDS